MSDIATTRTALALAVGANLPVLLWGAPGTGKTSAVLALAARLDLPVEAVIGSPSASPATSRACPSSATRRPASPRLGGPGGSPRPGRGCSSWTS